MNIAPLLLSLLLASAAAAAAAGDGYRVGDRLPQSKPAAAAAYKEIPWEALMPKNWDPTKGFKDLDLSKLTDGDPRANEALERMRKAWDEAPAEPSMNGARVRLPGFIVPLESQRDQISEFLLVPYFGACIHTPPPPANQIIHVVAAKPLKKGTQMMDAVWVSGALETVRNETDFGAAGYRMKADIVTPYKDGRK